MSNIQVLDHASSRKELSKRVANVWIMSLEARRLYVQDSVAQMVDLYNFFSKTTSPDVIFKNAEEQFFSISRDIDLWFASGWMSVNDEEWKKQFKDAA